MGLSCSCGDYDDYDWYHFGPTGGDYTTLSTKRSRRCCSCKDRISIGDLCTRFERARGPLTDIEERICGDEVPLAPWFMCEACSDQYFNLVELGFCFSLGDNMDDLRKEYVEMQGA